MTSALTINEILRRLENFCCVCDSDAISEDHAADDFEGSLDDKDGDETDIDLYVLSEKESCASADTLNLIQGFQQLKHLVLQSQENFSATDTAVIPDGQTERSCQPSALFSASVCQEVEAAHFFGTWLSFYASNELQCRMRVVVHEALCDAFKLCFACSSCGSVTTKEHFKRRDGKVASTFRLPWKQRFGVGNRTSDSHGHDNLMDNLFFWSSTRQVRQYVFKKAVSDRYGISSLSQAFMERQKVPLIMVVSDVDPEPSFSSFRESGLHADVENKQFSEPSCLNVDSWKEASLGLAHVTSIAYNRSDDLMSAIETNLSEERQSVLILMVISMNNASTLMNALPKIYSFCRQSNVTVHLEGSSVSFALLQPWDACSAHMVNYCDSALVQLAALFGVRTLCCTSIHTAHGRFRGHLENIYDHNGFDGNDRNVSQSTCPDAEECASVVDDPRNVDSGDPTCPLSDPSENILGPLLGLWLFVYRVGLAKLRSHVEEMTRVSMDLATRLENLPNFEATFVQRSADVRLSYKLSRFDRNLRKYRARQRVSEINCALFAELTSLATSLKPVLCYYDDQTWIFHSPSSKLVSGGNPLPSAEEIDGLVACLSSGAKRYELASVGAPAFASLLATCADLQLVAPEESGPRQLLAIGVFRVIPSEISENWRTSDDQQRTVQELTTQVVRTACEKMKCCVLAEGLHDGNFPSSHLKNLKLRDERSADAPYFEFCTHSEEADEVPLYAIASWTEDCPAPEAVKQAEGAALVIREALICAMQSWRKTTGAAQTLGKLASVAGLDMFHKKKNKASDLGDTVHRLSDASFVTEQSNLNNFKEKADNTQTISRGSEDEKRRPLEESTSSAVLMNTYDLPLSEDSSDRTSCFEDEASHGYSTDYDNTEISLTLGNYRSLSRLEHDSEENNVLRRTTSGLIDETESWAGPAARMKRSGRAGNRDRHIMSAPDCAVTTESFRAFRGAQEDFEENPGESESRHMLRQSSTRTPTIDHYSGPSEELSAHGDSKRARNRVHDSKKEQHSASEDGEESPFHQIGVIDDVNCQWKTKVRRSRNDEYDETSMRSDDGYSSYTDDEQVNSEGSSEETASSFGTVTSTPDSTLHSEEAGKLKPRRAFFSWLVRNVSNRRATDTQDQFQAGQISKAPMEQQVLFRETELPTSTSFPFTNPREPSQPDGTEHSATQFHVGDSENTSSYSSDSTADTDSSRTSKAFATCSRDSVSTDPCDEFSLQRDDDSNTASSDCDRGYPNVSYSSTAKASNKSRPVEDPSPPTAPWKAWSSLWSGITERPNNQAPRTRDSNRLCRKNSRSVTPKTRRNDTSTASSRRGSLDRYTNDDSPQISSVQNQMRQDCGSTTVDPTYQLNPSSDSGAEYLNVESQSKHTFRKDSTRDAFRLRGLAGDNPKKYVSHHRDPAEHFHRHAPENFPRRVHQHAGLGIEDTSDEDDERNGYPLTRARLGTKNNEEIFEINREKYYMDRSAYSSHDSEEAATPLSENTTSDSADSSDSSRCLERTAREGCEKNHSVERISSILSWFAV